MRDNLTNPFSPTRKLVAFLTTMMFVSVTIALILFETEVVAVGTVSSSSSAIGFNLNTMAE